MSERTVVPLVTAPIPNAGSMATHFRQLADQAEHGEITGYVAVLLRPGAKWSYCHNVDDSLMAVGMVEAAKIALLAEPR